MLIKKNIYFNLLLSFLLAVFFPLLAILSVNLNSTDLSYNIVKTTTSTAQNFITRPKTRDQRFVGSETNSSNVSDEMICEERNDDETKEDYIIRNSYSSNLFINLIKPTANLSSKEFAYYNSNLNYKTPVNLYTLFCSWKSYLN